MTSHRRSIYNRQLQQQRFEAFFRFPWRPLEINKLPQLSRMYRKQNHPHKTKTRPHTKLYFRKIIFVFAICECVMCISF